MNLDTCITDDVFEAGQKYPKAKLEHINRTTDNESIDYIVIFSGTFNEEIVKKIVTKQQGN